MARTSVQNENRGYVVWSIAIGAVLGFIINIFSNLYYGLFITGDLKWSMVNHQQVFIFTIVFIALIGYLQFFIFDYPNTFEFSKAYWKRYQQYFFYSFWPGKILRWIIGFYLIIVLLGFLFIIYYFIAQNIGYLYATIIFGVMIPLVYMKEKINKKNV